MMYSKFKVIQKFPIFIGSFFGFITPQHSTFNKNLKELNALVGKRDDVLVGQYEKEFAGAIGVGESVSYAAARMGFFELMLSLGIGEGDEVVLLGMNCSVMPAAVIRTGATPIFADVDANTFGSSARNISNVYTNNTKMVVAQHSFGIPCDIRQIRDFCDDKKLFLLEDCALSLGSKIDGKSVGTFGDAALFSTDHGKPLNSFLGGIIYSENPRLIAKLRRRSLSMGEIPLDKQTAMFKRLVYESKWSNPRTYAFSMLIDTIKWIFLPKSLNPSPFFDDGEVSQIPTAYPYPARMPAFLAALGRKELSARESRVKELQGTLRELIQLLQHKRIEIPFCYEDPHRQIVPLRFVFSPKNGSEIRKSFSSFLRVEHIWFREPIIARGNQSLGAFGYKEGSCKTSEAIGKNVIQLPIPVKQKDKIKLFKQISKKL